MANVLDTSTADLIGRDVAQRDGSTLRARLGELLRDVPDADLPALTTVLERFAGRRW